MGNRANAAFADESCVRPRTPLRQLPLSDWRLSLPAITAHAQLLAPFPDIWLPSLLDDLSRRFDGPLAVSDDGTVRTVTALDFVRYTIDRESRTLSCVLMTSGAPLCVPPTEFEVMSAWHRVGWLPTLLDQLPATRLAAMALSSEETAALRTWLARMIAPMIRRDGRFQRLRRELRQALRFDHDLFRLALRTRWNDGPEGLLGSRLVDVWRHAEHLRVVEKDAPRLLPLAFSALSWLSRVPATDTLGALKAHLSERGITDAGWRYLIRHGVRPVSAMGGGLRSDEIAHMAQALVAAGGHPPASAALVDAIAPTFAPEPVTDLHEIPENPVVRWLTSETRLAGAILKAAAEAKRTAEYTRFVDDMAAVLWWLADAQLATPKKSLRALVRLAREWEADQLAIARIGRRRWSASRSVPCPDGVNEAVLLEGPVAVLAEARAMRNCLRSRLPALTSQAVQVWSVRNRESGVRVALVELVWAEDRWVRGQVAARFNRAAPTWVDAFAETLAVCENLRTEAKGVER